MKRIAAPITCLGSLFFSAFCFLLLTLSAGLLSAQDSKEYLQAGAATSNITPDLGG